MGGWLHTAHSKPGRLSEVLKFVAGVVWYFASDAVDVCHCAGFFEALLAWFVLWQWWHQAVDHVGKWYAISSDFDFA